MPSHRIEIARIIHRVFSPLCAAALAIWLTAGACGRSEPSGPAPAPSAKAVTVRMVVYRDGTRLGVVEVPPGKPAVLTPEGEGGRAADLKKLIDEINARDSFQVKMHLPAGDGKRGPLGARIYRRSDADYVEGVQMKLIDEWYDVKLVE